MKCNKQNINNICTHFAENEISNFNSTVFPLVQTSNFKFNTYEDFMSKTDNEKDNFIYTRGSNPTTSLLEKRLACLEGGERAKVFSSGMAAISATVLSLIETGDHLLSINTIYGQANRFFTSLKKYGVEHSNVKGYSGRDIEKYIKDNTKIIYLESPSSQFMELVDLESISYLAKKRNIVTIIDNTWATPIFQNPLKYGIDICIHSMSKYINGNSDVVSGVVISNENTIDKIADYGFMNFGAVNSPFNSWLTTRSLTTLNLRMKQHEESVKKVIDFLSTNKNVKVIYHPYATKDYTQKKLSEKYLDGYGSLLSFELKDKDINKMIKFVNNLKIFSIGVSWGGFESLILPAYKGGNEDDLKNRGMSITHIRLFIGLEETNSLINDLKQSFDTVYK
jgi:cystathionine beta-lyase/cystathionine gamma-synthase